MALLNGQTCGVVISTYNNPEWLRLTLMGYVHQTVPPDEVLIADDGSDGGTRAVIDEIRARHIPGLKHCWHPDTGFEKCRILNQALAEASSDYLVFTDQDCVPRADFIAAHRRRAFSGGWLSGGYVMLPMDVSRSISDPEIASGVAFDQSWLEQRGFKLRHGYSRLTRSRWVAGVLDRLSRSTLNWNGCNSSGWRRDLLAARGFDERIKYGWEDTELGMRLRNRGLSPRQLRYSAICLHLDHARPYRDEALMERNRVLCEESRRSGSTETAFGL